MRRCVFFLLSLPFLFLAVSAAQPQIEFVAQVTAVTVQPDGNATLKLRLTPSYEAPVQVTPETEITDEDGDAVTIAELEVGMILRVSGIFTDDGVLAQETSSPTTAVSSVVFTVTGLTPSISTTKLAPSMLWTIPSM